MSEDVGYNLTSDVGADESWDQEVSAHVPGSSPFNHTITPTSGVVRISHGNDSGTRSYWNGSSFIEGAPISLATTIVGTRSYRQFTVPEEADGETILFEGWVVKGGVATPPIQRVVFIGEVGEAPGDVGLGTPQPVG